MALSVNPGSRCPKETASCHYIGHGGNPAPRPARTGYWSLRPAKAEADPQNGHGYREESREYNLQPISGRLANRPVFDFS